MEHELKSILAKQEIPPELVISYDDSHGLWGGTTIVIHGTGQAERRDWSRGAAEPELVETTIETNRLVEFIELLVEHAIWQPATTAHQPVPDEVRATLTIRVKGQASEISEWTNEAAKNKRLPELKARLLELTQPYQQ